MYKRILPLLLLIGVMVISGCIGQGPTGAANGIIIKDFYFDYSPIYAKDQIGLTLEVQNIGGERGQLEKINIFGVDIKKGGAGNLSWGSDEYLELNETYPTGGLPELAPPDPTTGMEGEVWSKTWLLSAPELIKVPTTYDFEVRVEYGYSSTLTGTIRIIESDYLRTLSQEERDKLIKQGGVVESSVTSGPMSLSAVSGRHFIVQKDANATSRKIRFRVTNTGSGFPFIDNTTEGLYLIEVINMVNLENCTDVRLSRGKSGMFSCDIEIPGAGELVNKMDKKFSVELNYSYFVDSATSITVNPIYVGERFVPPIQL